MQVGSWVVPLVSFALLCQCGDGSPLGPGGPDQDAAAAADAYAGPTQTMPIEVLGPANTVSSATFTLATIPAGGIKTLHLRTHGLNYQTAGSIQINGGTWIPLANSNHAVTVLGTAAKFGGIGGAFLVLDLNVALAGTELVAGDNVLRFRFNGTDGRSVGYRVLAFNVLDSQSTPLLPKEFFVDENPATWTPPRPAASDIDAGRKLWNTATLQDSPIKATHTLLAHCTDCHSQDARDLKYFNYSNNSIIQRSMFHGLSETQGEQIASFVRSNSSPNPGRVFNPPFQPGPGADSVPLSDWSAGMGIDAVLTDDASIQPFLPTSAAALTDPDTSGMTLARYNAREAPVAIPLLDWNHWLPAISPADALGSVAAFQASGGYTDYQKLRTGLSVSDPKARNAYIQTQLLNDADTWYVDRGALEASITAKQGSGTQAAFVDNYAAAVWTAQKMWEIVQEFDLQGVGRELYGLAGERASWFISNRFVFDVSPHAINGVSGADDLTAYQIFGDPTLGNTCPVNASNPTGSCRVLMNSFVASNWYDVQLVVNGGARRSAHSVHQVIDWGYMKNFENIDLQGGIAEPMRLARFAIKSMDELDTGVTPANTAWGWNYRDEITEFVQVVHDSSIAGGWGTNPIYGKTLTALYQTWLEKSAAFDPATWQSVEGTSYDGENLAPASYVLGSGTFPSTSTKDDNLNRSFIDHFAAETTTLKALQQPAALVDGMTAFGSLLYPANDWSAMRPPVAALAAPSNVGVAATGVEQLSVSWSAVSGASSYNVKRVFSTGQPALTIAYFVKGTSYVDRNVIPGKAYQYVVSANTTNDAAEGHDSAPVASPAAQSGLVSQWMLGGTLTQGALVPDVANAAPRSSGQVFQNVTGDSYVSLAQNMTRWLGASATLTAFIQLPSGAKGSGSFSTLPAIAGSTGRTREEFYYGVLDTQGRVGVAAMGCDGTSASQPAFYSAQPLNDGAWHHVALTRNAQNGNVQVYVDGVLSSSGTSGSGTCQGISRSLGRIDSATSGQAWPGLLKDVRVYDAVLGASAIAAIAQGK